MGREVELGWESWTSFASGCSSTAVQRTLSLWLCPARQLKQLLCSALVAAQWRGDTALTLPLFWRRSTASPVFFGRYPGSSLHSFVPFRPPPPPPPPAPPSPSPSLISSLASVDVKQPGQGHDDVDIVTVTLFYIAVGTAIAWCCGRCAMPDGHCLNILLFLRRSTAAFVFRVGACFEVSLFCPSFPTRPRP